MQKGIFASLATMIALVAVNGHAADFDATYFFGDSLTDSGTYIIQETPFTTGRFTVDPGHVWSEDLAAHYGTTAVPYGLFVPSTSAQDPQQVVTLGGTNYAQGGARVAQKPGVGILNAVPVSNQIDGYLGATGRADPDALYTVWGGANDVFFQAAAVGSGAATPGQVAQGMEEAASAEVAQVARLHNAGAHYLLVPNLPDIGVTPAALLQGIQATGAAIGADDATINNAVMAAIQKLRAGDADGAVAAAAAALGVPDAAVKGARELLGGAFSQLSGIYNQQLQSALGSAGFEVIPLDVHSLLDEVLADPGSYGFDNVIAPACNTSSALQCNAGTVDTSQRYFFADEVHPTPQAHAILAEYAASVIDAPGLISLLPNVVVRAGLSQVGALDDHARVTRRDPDSRGLNAFINGGLNDLKLGADSGVDDVNAVNRNFTAGVDWQFADNALLGVALGYSGSDPSFGHDSGGFTLHDKLAMVYAGFGFGHAYVNATAGYGWLDFNDVERDIQLGTATRVEKSDVDGHQQLLRLAGGYHFDFGAFATGPVAALTYQQVHVGSYSEGGDRSTSMHFDAQNLYSLMGSFGWQAGFDIGETAVGSLRPYVRASYEQEFKNDRDRVVTAGLNSFGGDFSMPAYQADRYYTEIVAGLDDRIGRATTVSLSLSTVVGQSGGRSDSVVLGLNHRF